MHILKVTSVTKVAKSASLNLEVVGSLALLVSFRGSLLCIIILLVKVKGAVSVRV